MNVNLPGPITTGQLLAYFESAVNEMKAHRVPPASDVDGRTGYAVMVDHVIFCALLRDETVFMELSQSLIIIRRPEQPDETRTAMYYGPLGIFLVIP